MFLLKFRIYQSIIKIVYFSNDFLSGDYALEVSLDIDSFQRSKYISLYDAVKQGAFARFFSKDAFGMYLVKKLYMGAEEASLMGLAQMCVDQAVSEYILLRPVFRNACHDHI